MGSIGGFELGSISRNGPHHQETVGAHGRQLVPKVRRKRPVLVKNKVEVHRNTGHFLREVGRLLKMGLPTPAPFGSKLCLKRHEYRLALSSPHPMSFATHLLLPVLPAESGQISIRGA